MIWCQIGGRENSLPILTVNAGVEGIQPASDPVALLKVHARVVAIYRMKRIQPGPLPRVLPFSVNAVYQPLELLPDAQ